MSEIRFTNETGSTVWVAVMFYSPDGCAAYGKWGTQGWWQIAPGGTAARGANVPGVFTKPSPAVSTASSIR